MRNQEVKRLIIDTTKQLVRTKDNITIKDIADACYANIASVNYHFGTKDELILIVVLEIIDEIKEELNHIFQKIDAYESLHHFFDDIVLKLHAFAVQNHGVITLIYFNQSLHNELITLFMLGHNRLSGLEKKMMEHINPHQAKDQKTIYLRYLMIVSALLIPIFFGIRDVSSDQLQRYDFKEDEAFRKLYIDSLINQLIS
jgi:TetR/AcrR family transcriptional regulator, regulator of cefoperazone and chloramphenicol sensitivity